jgi:hypothetical protein
MARHAGLVVAPALFVSLALIACGDNRAPLDDSAGAACSALFSGGFDEVIASTDACGALSTSPGSSDVLLGFSLQSSVLGAQVVISFDLGPTPTIGGYSSETVSSWHAVGAQSLGNGGCVYSAGDQVVPTGSFTLTLTSLAPAPHGNAMIDEYVHALDGTDCGPADTEVVQLVF